MKEFYIHRLPTTLSTSFGRWDARRIVVLMASYHRSAFRLSFSAVCSLFGSCPESCFSMGVVEVTSLRLTICICFHLHPSALRFACTVPHIKNVSVVSAIYTFVLTNVCIWTNAIGMCPSGAPVQSEWIGVWGKCQRHPQEAIVLDVTASQRCCRFGY